MRLADQVGENILHIKCTRKRWYNDSRWADKSKPPVDAPAWTISSSYQSDEDDEDDKEDDEEDDDDDDNEMDELDHEEEGENAAASGSGNAGGRNEKSNKEIIVTNSDSNETD